MHIRVATPVCRAPTSIHHGLQMQGVLQRHGVTRLASIFTRCSAFDDLAHRPPCQTLFVVICRARNLTTFWLALLPPAGVIFHKFSPCYGLASALV